MSRIASNLVAEALIADEVLSVDKRQITKPQSRTYWLASKDQDVHYGYTDPGQTTTCGLGELSVYSNEQDWLNALSAHAEKLPQDNEDLRNGDVYNDNGTAKRKS